MWSLLIKITIPDGDSNEILGSGSTTSSPWTSSPLNPPMPLTGTSTPSFLNTFTQSWREPGVIGDLSDSLRDIGIAKSDHKRLYDAGVQKTQQRGTVEKEKTKRLEICESLEVEQMQNQNQERFWIEASGAKRTSNCITRTTNENYPQFVCTSSTLPIFSGLENS